MYYPLPVSGSGMYVGKAHWNDPMFVGQMKDLLVWDVALSTAELDAKVRLGGGLPARPADDANLVRFGSAVAATEPSFAAAFAGASPIDGPFTFTGASASYISAVSRTGSAAAPASPSARGCTARGRATTGIGWSTLPTERTPTTSYSHSTTVCHIRCATGQAITT